MPKSKSPSFRRRKYIVDRSLQLSMATTLLGILCIFALLFTAAVLIMPSDRAFDLVSGEQVRHLILGVNGIWFFAIGAGLAVVTILLTHRVAGPAWVLRQAIDSMMRGDFNCRTSIRKKDYLQGLSEATGALKLHLETSARRRSELLDRLEEAIEQGDTERARRVIRVLRSKTPVRPMQVRGRE